MEPADAVFDKVTISGNARFNKILISGNARFNGATIERDARFSGATINGDVSFEGATIEKDVRFERAKIYGRALFEGATINGNVIFSLSTIGYLTFKDATFNSMSGQEEACLAARKIQEIIGDRVLADYHFYREMEAKKKRKHPVRRFLELSVQYIFGYGVHPFWVVGSWFLTVFCLALVYWIGGGIEAANSFFECLYFSVVTAATPGYGGYHPKPGLYQVLASFEAIFGTFMWAAFIATFARKYMR